MKRERVDRLLVEQGLAPSRTRAQALVMAGRVLVGEQRVEKSSETFPTDAPLRVRGSEGPASRYVGRGGLEVERALEEFGVEGRGGVVRDPAQHARVVEEVNEAARSLGLRLRGVTESPITGADGNREFLALYEKA